MPVSIENTVVRFNDGTTQSTAFTGGGGPSGINGQTFTSSGTFTIPSGVTSVSITVIGGGGGGNGGGPGYPGLGGGAGGVAIGYRTGLTPGGTLSVTVGGQGGTSSVSSGSQSISTISATGGGGGVGGNGSGGSLNLPGERHRGQSGGVSILGGSPGTGPTVAATGYGNGGGGGNSYFCCGNPNPSAGTGGAVIIEF